MNRVIAVFLALILLAAPRSAARAQDEFTEITRGPITYLIDKGQSHAMVKRCDLDAAGTLVIPSSIDGMPVKHVLRKAFQGCGKITEVILPKSLESIDISFLQCGALKRVALPGGVRRISELAFFDCDQVTLEVSRGSYAQAYAQTYRIPYQCREERDADFNGDGQINALDPLLILQITVEMISCRPEEQNNKADVDGNGRIDPADALLVLQSMAFRSENDPVWIYSDAPRNCEELISHRNQPELKPKIIRDFRLVETVPGGGRKGQVFVNALIHIYQCTIRNLDGSDPQPVELGLQSYQTLIEGIFEKGEQVIAFMQWDDDTERWAIPENETIYHGLFSLCGGVVTPIAPDHRYHVFPEGYRLPLEQFCELVKA